MQRKNGLCNVSVSLIIKHQVIILLAVLFFQQIFTAEPVYANSWLEGWSHRRAINIDNLQNGGSLIDYQVKASVNYESRMKNNFSDVRFTAEDGSTLLSYWMETYSDSSFATFWIKVPSIAASSISTLYMYYGNSAVSVSTSNGPDTFPLFDDFSGSGLDSNVWTQQLRGTGSAVSVADSECQLHVADAETNSASIESKMSFTSSMAINVKRRSNDNEYIEFSLGSGNLTDTEGGETYWWNTGKYGGYYWFTGMYGNDPSANEIYKVPTTGSKTALTDNNAFFSTGDIANYHIYQYTYDSSGQLGWHIAEPASVLKPVGEWFEKYNAPLNFPPHDANFGSVHPDALLFKDGEDSYQVWIYYETVGFNNAEYIDLVRTNDGVTLNDPTGTHVLSPSASAEDWDSLWVADPSVLKVGNTWYMYYTGGKDVHTSIGLAVSADGKSWTRSSAGINQTSKILEADSSLSHEAGLLLVSPSAYYDGTTFWLWYTAKDASGNMSLNLAESTDGIHWIKSINNPVYVDSGETIWHMDIARFNGEYLCYFNHGSVGPLRLLKSADKIHWSVSTDPVLEARQEWEGDHIYRSSPLSDPFGNLVLKDSQMWLYYSTRNTDYNDYRYFRIGLAKSGYSFGEVYAKNTDPLNIPTHNAQYGTVHPNALFFRDAEDTYKFWIYYATVDSNNSIYIDLVRSNDGVSFNDPKGTHVLSPTPGAWDSLWVDDPSVIKVGDTWYMYYTGGQNTHTRIGLAISTDGINWSKQGIVLASDLMLDNEQGDILVSPSAYYDGSKFWLWMYPLSQTVPTV